jgi:hypothetical protein
MQQRICSVFPDSLAYTAVQLSAAACRQVDLLSALDKMGVGVATTITRTWEASGAELQLKGTWSQHPEARRMAMLAVYQVGRPYCCSNRHSCCSRPPQGMLAFLYM